MALFTAHVPTPALSQRLPGRGSEDLEKGASERTGTVRPWLAPLSNFHRKTNMNDGQASRTALLAAKARACHQLLDHPKVFDDPLAVKIIGEAFMRDYISLPPRQRDILCRAGRGALVARSRVAEDALGEAMARGVMQCVVLGAGLDTLACRNPYGKTALRMFEVDHPATQAWKRGKLREAQIAEPDNLTFVPIDFATQNLSEALRLAGFRADQPAFFCWLGVTMYLTPAMVKATLGYIASLPGGSGVVFDFMYRQARWDLPMRLMLWVLTRRYARMGEPWIGFFEPRQLVSDMVALGFSAARHLTGAELNSTLFASRSDDLRIRLERMGGVMVATV